MGEPMGEDPIPQVGEKETVPETQEETLTSTTDPALVRRRKKLLGESRRRANSFNQPLMQIQRELP